MDKYLDYQVNTDDIAGISLEDILAEFGAGKYTASETVSGIDFDIADLDAYIEDLDVKYYKSKKKVPAKQESIYMQEEFMNNEYKAEDKLFDLDDILREYDADPGFTIDPEAEAAGAIVVEAPKAAPVHEIEVVRDFDDYADDDDYEDEKPKKRAPKNLGKKSNRKSEPEDDDEDDDYDADDWGDESEDEDVVDYSEMSAKELYELCKERGIKVAPKKPAKFYIN